MSQLNFTNRFQQRLPADPSTESSPRQVYQSAYSSVKPTPVSDPRIIAHSPSASALLNLTSQDMKSPLAARIFSGNAILDGMKPYASCYGGHQFGNWAGQLGDGRAITLGEIKNTSEQHWEIQLKGAGPTPYSRMADGRAVLRSSVREFLCSEAMFHLGVPTTRALCLSKTGDTVLRDMFYDGHPEYEMGSICTRLSPSFIRFGNFEIFASRNDKANLQELCAFTIENYFPELGPVNKDSILEFYYEVCRRTAETIVKWMGVGFVHGVMNTDNMSILGLTIDYGPYGWLEPYDLQWTPNTTDAQGRRYAYGAQPNVGMWNLSRLAQALYPLIEDVPALQRGLDMYSTVFPQSMNQLWAQKLGFDQWLDEDETLCQRLNQTMQETECDFTLFYRTLSGIAKNGKPNLQNIIDICDHPLSDLEKDSWLNWISDYQKRRVKNDLPEIERTALMNTVNPQFVLRNWVVQTAIDASNEGDEGPLNKLLERLQTPYANVDDFEKFETKRPLWARNRAGCSMLSCSS